MINHKAIATTLLILLLACFLGGCGGGGGGGTPAPTGMVVTGRVLSYQSQSTGVAGAMITIDAYSGLTDSQGRFQVVLTSPTVAPTFTVTAPSGYYGYWAYYNSQAIRPNSLPTPLPLYNGKDVGNIYLWDQAYLPPPVP